MDSESIVFDFGRVATRILLLEGSGKAFRVRDFAVVPHGRHDSDDEKKTLLRPALFALNAKVGTRAILTWEEGLVFRQLSLPDMPPDDLQKAFLWEMKEKYLFSGEGSFYASECAVETANEEGVREKLYNVFYCDKPSAAHRIALAESLGYRVASVVPGQSAVAIVVNEAGVDSQRDVLVFDIGFQSARVLVVRDGKIMLSRTVLLGGQALTDMMTASYFDARGDRVQLGPADADALKLREGAKDPQAGHIGLVRPYLEKIVSEIKRSVDYYEGQKYSRPISKVVFTGGGANLQGLTAYMGRFLGLEVAPLRPDNFTSPSLLAAKRQLMASEFAAFAAGVGAAMDSAPNLLPRQHTPRARRARSVSARLALALAAILVVFLDTWTFFQVRLAKAQLVALAVEFRELDRIGALVADLDARQRFMRVALKGDLSHPALLKALSRVTPPAMTFEKLTFRREDGILTIEGTVAETGRSEVKIIAQFISDLLRTPFFRDVTLADSTPEPAERRQRFQVRCLTAGVL